MSKMKSLHNRLCRASGSAVTPFLMCLQLHENADTCFGRAVVVNGKVQASKEFGMTGISQFQRFVYTKEPIDGQPEKTFIRCACFQFPADAKEMEHQIEENPSCLFPMSFYCTSQLL